MGPRHRVRPHDGSGRHRAHASLCDQQRDARHYVAIAVVLVELGIISWIRHRYMDTTWYSATVQVIIGGVLVFLTGVLIGDS